jgi:hypothetical protein
LRREVKVKLLQYWFDNPERAGHVPEELKKDVTTKDFLQLRKEMKDAPLRRGNIFKAMKKTKYGLTEAEMSAKRSYKVILPFLVVFLVMVGVQLYIIFGTRISGDLFILISVAVFSSAVFIGMLAAITLHRYRKAENP